MTDIHKPTLHQVGLLYEYAQKNGHIADLTL